MGETRNADAIAAGIGPSVASPIHNKAYSTVVVVVVVDEGAYELSAPTHTIQLRPSCCTLSVRDVMMS